MGKGINLARGDAPIHAAVLDDFKDQLLIALVKRLADKKGIVNIPVAEVDATGNTILMLAVDDGMFQFEVRAKQ